MDILTEFVKQYTWLQHDFVDRYRKASDSDTAKFRQVRGPLASLLITGEPETHFCPAVKISLSSSPSALTFLSCPPLAHLQPLLGISAFL